MPPFLIKPLILSLYLVLLFVFRWPFEWQTIWLMLGVVLGTSIVLFDRFLQVLIVRPHEQLSQQVIHLLKHRRPLDAYRLLNARAGEQPRLLSLTVLFIFAYIPLSLFVLSSTGSAFAVGFILGTGLKIFIEHLAFWSDLPLLERRLYWPLKHPLSPRFTRYLLIGFGLWLALLTRWSV